MRAAARRYIADAPRVAAISELAAPPVKKRASRISTSLLAGVGTARTYRCDTDRHQSEEHAAARALSRDVDDWRLHVPAMVMAAAG